MKTPRLTRHERRRLQTRNLLMQTTLKLILEKGYDSVSIQNITDEADLGRGTFYIHFKDKEEVVWAMLQELCRELEEKAHCQLDLHMPQVEFYGLLNIFRHVEENRDLYCLIFGKQGSLRLLMRAQDFLTDIFLHDIQNSLHHNSVDFKLPQEFEAQLLTGIISRLIAWWLDSPNSYTPEQMAIMMYKALYRKQPPILDS